MRLELLLFGAILALLTLALYLAWGVPPLEGVGGYPHESFAGMRTGGSGVERHGAILGAGWAFGVVSLLVFTLLIGFGARRGERLRGMGRALAFGFVLNAGIFSWLMLSYGDYAAAPVATSILGFPLSSAILLYLFYPASAIFNLYFVVGFRRWVLTEEDESRYEEIVARLERRRGGGADS